MMREQFAEAYRLARAIRAFRTSHMAAANHLARDLGSFPTPIVTAAINAAFWRTEWRGAVQCSKEAPDRRVAIRLGLSAVRHRRSSGWTRVRAERFPSDWTSAGSA